MRVQIVRESQGISICVSVRVLVQKRRIQRARTRMAMWACPPAKSLAYSLLLMNSSTAVHVSFLPVMAMAQVPVGIDLHPLAQRPTGPLTSRPDRGPIPRRGWWAPVAQPYKEEVGTDGSEYEVHRRHCSPPQNANPIREGGLQRREAPPRHHRHP